VAAGYGITPYGIGDWGSENTIIPGTGSVTTQHGWGIGAWNGNYGWGEADLNTAPIVQTGIVPSGGAVLIGSAPVVIVVERVKTPGTGVLGFVGNLPQLRVDFFATPAANDAVITGHAPNIAFSSISQTFTGAASLAGVAPLSVVGGFSQPDTGSLNVAGQTPETATTYTPGTGSINVQGHAPSLVREKVVTPTGGAVLIGSAPVVIVRESVKTPGVGAVNILGRVPAVAQSKVITPASGNLFLVGSAPVLKNPNWVNIDDSQTANWQNVVDSQTANWVAVAA
jgi:hypothetical protein